MKNGALQRFLKQEPPRLRTDVDEMPPFECFISDVQAIDAKRKFMSDVNVGDELCVRVRRVELAAIYVQPLCVLRPFRRTLSWIDDFQVLVNRNVQSARDIRPNDLLKVVVAESDEARLLNLIMDDSAELLSEADLPAYFRSSKSLQRGCTFEECLSNYDRLNNPNLAQLYGVEVDSTVSFLPELQGVDFSSKTRAPYLRRKQDEESSMQSTLKGVERIREGESQLAIQHFNKALSLFERNIEAVVGRAAAYANLGDYNAAENDLDKALTMNRNHGNAQAYMVETLLQAAKKMEELNKLDEAKAKYEKILRIKDDTRARERLRRLDRSPAVQEITVTKRRKRLSSAEKEEIRRNEHERKEKERRERRKTAEKLAEIERFIAQLKEEKT